MHSITQITGFNVITKENGVRPPIQVNTVVSKGFCELEQTRKGDCNTLNFRIMQLEQIKKPGKHQRKVEAEKYKEQH